jgi:hypothetical protein
MTKYFGLFLIVIGTKFLYEYFNLWFSGRIHQFSQFFEATHL